jgi:hypothetical protein
MLAGSLTRRLGFRGQVSAMLELEGGHPRPQMYQYTRTQLHSEYIMVPVHREKHSALCTLHSTLGKHSSLFIPHREID